MTPFDQAKAHADSVAPAPADTPVAAAATAFGFGLLVIFVFLAAQWLGAPDADLKAEIAALELRAAAIIRSKVDRELAPLEASIQDARRQALELLKRPP